MAEIIHQTESWNGQKGSHYLEIKVNGKTLQIIVDDDHVNVIGPAPFKDVCAQACNSFYAMLDGGRFETVQQYHEYMDSGKIPTPAQRD